jgi:CHAD domain-containing protein
VLELGDEPDAAVQLVGDPGAQVDDLLEGRDAVATVVDGVALAHRGQALCGPQRRREVLHEPVVGVGDAVDHLRGSPAGELGVVRDVRGGADRRLVAHHEDVVLGGDEVRFDVAGEPPAGSRRALTDLSPDGGRAAVDCRVRAVADALAGPGPLARTPSSAGPHRSRAAALPHGARLTARRAGHGREVTYRLRFDEEVPAGLRRVLDGELQSAAARLERDHAEDPVEAVHDARTHLKKARAALRLARPGMPGSAVREADRALRDRGRALAGVRDADVLVEVVDGLAERFVGRVPASTFDAVRTPLAAHAAERRAAGGIDVAAQADQLRSLAAEAADWPLGACDGRTLARGLRFTYSRGRDALERAERRPEPERLHEWRKRVKDLWYQEQLLSAAWPEVLKAQATQARALSRLLGDDHDLALLGELLAVDDGLAVAADAELLALVAARRAELTQRALTLGHLVYAEPPKAFGRRMQVYVRAAAAEAQAPAAMPPAQS